MDKTSVQVSTAPCEWCGRVGGFHEQQCCAPVPLPPAPHPSDNARSSLDLTEAFRIAVEVHGAQRDKAGEPYMGHICRVMSAMDTDEERAVAILHDALEDCGKENQMHFAQMIWDAYPREVWDAVLLLTRSRVLDSTYLDYIRRLSTNPLAVKCKFADIQDNRNPQRLRKLPRAECDRLYDKYEQAWLTLYAAADEAGTLPDPICFHAPGSVVNVHVPHGSTLREVLEKRNNPTAAPVASAQPR